MITLNDEETCHLQKPIPETFSILDQNGIAHGLIRWEYMKIEIMQFSINSFKPLSNVLMEKENFSKTSSRILKILLILLW